MQIYDIIIRNGNIVFPDKVRKMDIGVKNGVIMDLSEQLIGDALEIWQAENQYVFPGMIDIHVHFSEPGREHWEGFATGSKMMAGGGCTTYFDMPLNGIPSTVTMAALEEKVKIGKTKSVIDFGLWGGLIPGNEAELTSLAESGVIGFKAFMCESGNKEFQSVDDVTLLKGMKVIASLGKILALHAESEPITKWLKYEKERAGAFSADDYAASRPILAEMEAVQRSIYFAALTGCPLHFVHISSAAAMEKIDQAKQRGLDVTAETCAHYLLFNHDSLAEKGAVAKCSPPLRDQKEQEKLLDLLIAGKFDMVTSDHSPCPYELKDPATHNVFEAWGGISGGQFTLMSMIELALKYRIPFPKIAEWTSAAPARRFGLTKKGAIRVGMDADFAIVSLKHHHHVMPENFLARHKHSLYLGHTFPCKNMTTFNRGRLVFENGKTPTRTVKGLWVKGEPISAVHH